MKKNKRRLTGFLMLLVILVCGLLTGCQETGRDTGSGTVSISIVDASSADRTEEAGSDSAGTDQQQAETEPEEEPLREVQQYYFRNARLLAQHYEKHGIEMGFASEEEYEEAASAVINNPDALHKKEKEDNDEVYYVEATNEFAVLSEDGYIRTYFNPNAGIRYYNRQ